MSTRRLSHNGFLEKQKKYKEGYMPWVLRTPLPTPFVLLPLDKSTPPHELVLKMATPSDTYDHSSSDYLPPSTIDLLPIKLAYFFSIFSSHDSPTLSFEPGK